MSEQLIPLHCAPIGAYGNRCNRSASADFASFPHDRIVTRGGFVTKIGKRAASCAPLIGLVGMIMVFGAAEALAANECGLMGTGTTVICDATTYTGPGAGTETDPAQTTLDYRAAFTTDPTIILNNFWVESTIPQGVWLQTNSPGGPVFSTVIMNDGSIVKLNDPGRSRDAIRVNDNSATSAGSLVTLNGDATIRVETGSSSGVFIRQDSLNATGDATIILNDIASILTTRSDPTTQQFSHAVFTRIAGNTASGNAVIVLNDDASITTDGVQSHGIIAWISGTTSTGDATVTLNDNATVSTRGTGAFGANAWITGENATGDAIITMNGNASITTTGLVAYGMDLRQRGAGAAIVRMTGGTVSVSGEDAEGIFAFNSGAGIFDLDISGGSITSGTGMAAGIRAIAAAGGTIDIGAAAVIDSTASGIAIRVGDWDLDGVDET